MRDTWHYSEVRVFAFPSSHFKFRLVYRPSIKELVVVVDDDDDDVIIYSVS
jgi:hypothetical protein